jgi:hypothetical protein
MVIQPPYPVAIKGASRYHLPKLFQELGFTKGVEVGVWEGEYSEMFCQGIPGLDLLCVDPWMAYSDYGDYKQPGRMERSFGIATKRLAPYHCRLMRMFSVDAAEEIPNGSLDFMYIDGNHQLEFVIADLAAWIPKVRVGGVIAGHDYKSVRHHPQLQVVEAINAWTAAYRVEPWFVLGRQKARPSEERDLFRSWLWVKS